MDQPLSQQLSEVAATIPKMPNVENATCAYSLQMGCVDGYQRVDGFSNVGSKHDCRGHAAFCIEGQILAFRVSGVPCLPY